MRRLQHYNITLLQHYYITLITLYILHQLNVPINVGTCPFSIVLIKLHTTQVNGKYFCTFCILSWQFSTVANEEKYSSMTQTCNSTILDPISDSISSINISICTICSSISPIQQWRGSTKVLSALSDLQSHSCTYCTYQQFDTA